MKDTNQLPPSEREAFEAFAQNCPMGKYSIARRGDGYDSSHTQLMWDAWQARAQVQGEPMAWLHWLNGPVRVFMNKDEAMMELDRLNREYPLDTDDRKMRPLILGDTAPQATPVCGAQNAESDPQAPLSLTAAPQQATPDDMKVYDSIADRYFREATQAELTDADMEQVLTLAHSYADAKLMRYGALGIKEPPDPAAAFIELRRAILTLRPERVPMTDEQIWILLRDLPTNPGEMPDAWSFAQGVREAEFHHGSAAQAKKETP